MSAKQWGDLCRKAADEYTPPDEQDFDRARYIVQRLAMLDILPGGTYEPAMENYLALYLADVRRAALAAGKDGGE